MLDESTKGENGILPAESTEQKRPYEVNPTVDRFLV